MKDKLKELQTRLIEINNLESAASDKVASGYQALPAAARWVRCGVWPTKSSPTPA